ncbi:hypothetical protein ACWGI8_01235 [Streptomyces sp. NPDC054841]
MNKPAITAAESSDTRADAPASCCGPAPSQASTAAPPASPCCGTSEAAEEAGSCCDPAAKREAVATSTGCC